MLNKFKDTLLKNLEKNTCRESSIFQNSHYNQAFRTKLLKQATAPRKGAVLLLFYPNSNSICISFMRRTKVGSHKNQISLPGGKADKNDISIIHTALREFEEEFGVDSKEIEILGQLSPIFIPPSNFLVYPIIGSLNYTPNFKPNPDEVDYLIECTLDELMDLKNLKNGILKEFEIEVPLPYFEIKNEIIWGATAAIIDEFIEIYKS